MDVSRTRVPRGGQVNARDPHIHVQARLRAQAAVRNIVASTFGLVGDLPSRVATGCGVEVPYVMTSPRPESVTCLACREYAYRQHLRAADQAERWGGAPGTGVDIGGRAAQAAVRHRDLARRFADPTA
jgi:hypothetical protein